MLKDTIAIIGATSNEGWLLANKLLTGNFRVLLMDNDLPQLNLMLHNINTVDINVDVAIVDCCRNASWEADIIIIAVPANQQIEVAKKIKEVATQKMVVFINSFVNTEIILQEILPQSRLVFVLLEHINKEVNYCDAILKSINSESLLLAGKIFESAGIKIRV